LVTIPFYWNVAAQEEKKPQEGTPSEALAAIRLANELVKYGYANNEALPLIQAVEIIVSTPTQKLETVKTEQVSKSDAENAKTTGISYAPATLLADAKELAQGDETLLALIKKVESQIEQPSRGRVNGPGEAHRRVYGGSTITDYVTFKGNFLAEVLVSGDGDTDLDLYVYDENGNLVESDTDYTDDCYVRWYPKWTGTFVVKVVNRGRVHNDYVLLTN
jgi:hypothetical protein